MQGQRVAHFPYFPMSTGWTAGARIRAVFCSDRCRAGASCSKRVDEGARRDE